MTRPPSICRTEASERARFGAAGGCPRTLAWSRSNSPTTNTEVWSALGSARRSPTSRRSRSRSAFPLTKLTGRSENSRTRALLETRRTRGPARFYLYYRGFTLAEPPEPRNRTGAVSETAPVRSGEPFQEPSDRGAAEAPAPDAVPPGKADSLGSDRGGGDATPSRETPGQPGWPLVGEARPRSRWLTSGPVAESRGLLSRIGPVPQLKGKD